MGGSMFPAARKLAASRNADTLVINAVECEPGVTIDKALLLHHSHWIRAGAEASAEYCGAKRIIIAMARHRKFAKEIATKYPFEQLLMPKGYPGGAERLIVKKLRGKLLPAGTFPGQLGILVQNTASMRAIGRALLDGIPVVERPMTVAAPIRKIHKNVIVPVGMQLNEIIERCGITTDPLNEVIIAGGLMMGKVAEPDELATKGTTSIMIVPKAFADHTESNCIKCGACNVACPLNLHPIGMVERCRDTKTPLSKATRIQIENCFLCGACSAVCPARIPLVKYIREGKTCLCRT
jgi:electron transport complex protein RnfC